MLDIEKAREICERATPGPWIFQNGYCYQDNQDDGGEFNDALWTAHPVNKDARFIAFARTALPEALLELEAARDVVASVDAHSAGMICGSCIKTLAAYRSIVEKQGEENV